MLTKKFADINRKTLSLHAFRHYIYRHGSSSQKFLFKRSSFLLRGLSGRAVLRPAIRPGLQREPPLISHLIQATLSALPGCSTTSLLFAISSASSKLSRPLIRLLRPNARPCPRNAPAWKRSLESPKKTTAPHRSLQAASHILNQRRLGRAARPLPRKASREQKRAQGPPPEKAREREGKHRLRQAGRPRGACRGRPRRGGRDGARPHRLPTMRG